jgi:putative transposase
MARTGFAPGEYYHVYNRGVDKRNIVGDEYDADRFMQSLVVFNTKIPVGSLWLMDVPKNKGRNSGVPLVELIAYCLNPNHFHLILKEKTEGGISELMKRLGGGYTWYFNHRHKRQGALFQGRFRAKHVKDNAHMLHLSAYVNLNDKVHKLSGPTAQFVRSSWGEYSAEKSEGGFCKKNLILGQFRSVSHYRRFALDNLPYMLSKRKGYEELKELLFD